jgi:predicted nucleic acid-binding Zn ribbon protein
MNDDEEQIRRPSSRQLPSEAKLRRGKKHCPVCLIPLGKNAARTRLMRKCRSCQGQLTPGKHCLRCGAAAVWENKNGAACQACGLHGTKAAVFMS